MTKTVVVYHSGYGHTKVVAEHVAQGAGDSTSLVAISADGDVSDEDWVKLNSADAIIFGTPTYMGNVSWQFKKFADATSPLWLERSWQDKVFGGFTISASSNGDKQVALIALHTLASQHGGIWVSLGLAPSSTKAATYADVNNMGGSVGLLARAPADAGTDEIHTGDLETAILYGARVSKIAAQLRG